MMRRHLISVFILSLLTAAPISAGPATLVVATQSSSDKSKQAADFVGDGEGDQEEINAALEALPEAGGTVQLMEGVYDIRRVEGELGGVIIDSSFVTLAGQGASTKLVQAASQETNVIRVIGSGVAYVTIRDLWVDANRDENPLGAGDPNVSHARFEFCGIKAYYRKPGGPGGETHHDITIRDCYVFNSRRLGIMLEGINMRVLDNVLGNAMSDSVEILTGPGQIRGNYFEITGRTHVACGSDRGNDILMSDNVVHVKETGDIDIGFRSWSGSERHVIAGNTLRVEPGGKLGAAMEVRGTGATVTGNAVHGADENEPLPLKITGGNTIVTGNLFENVVIEVDDKTDENKPIVIKNNLMENSEIAHVKGNLVTE